MLWHSLNRVLDQLRPRRQGVVMLADAFLILLAWHFTYLFRMGMERWLHERPSYDGSVLLCVIAVYSVVSWALGVPRVYFGTDGPGFYTRLGAVLHQPVRADFCFMRFDLPPQGTPEAGS